MAVVVTRSDHLDIAFTYDLRLDIAHDVGFLFQVEITLDLVLLVIAK